MMNIGFDNEKYLQMQSAHIRERIAQFDNKLYLEFGGKLFDDFHASRVLPGFQPDSKMRMLMQLSDQAEIVIVISAEDIEKNKVRGDLGITYDVDVLRLMSIFEEHGLFVGSVVITKYSGQQSASLFKNKLEKLGIKVYLHYPIEGYPSNIPHIVSDEGYGKNEFIETYAGQIGYSVRPTQRRKGYASEILRLTLIQASHYGFQKILITCNEPNSASSRVIEKNGGILEKVIPHPGFPNVKRYYIDLK